MDIDRRTIDGEVIRFRFAGLPCLLANAPLPVRVFSYARVIKHSLKEIVLAFEEHTVECAGSLQ